MMTPSRWPSPATGEVYVAGSTDSADFPNTAGGAQASKGGFFDAFVARLNATLTSNLQSTYLGGSGGDSAFALAIAGSGDVYVAGETVPPTSPTPAAARRKATGGSQDAFVARLDQPSPTPTSSPPTWGEAVSMGPRPGHLSHNGEVRGGGHLFHQLPQHRRRRAGKQRRRPPTPSWRGLTPTSPPTSSPPTWGEAGAMGLRAGHRRQRRRVRGGADLLPPTSPTPAAARRRATAAATWDAFVARLDATLTQNPQSTYLGGSGTMRPSRWPSPAAATCTWRGTPIPPTSPTPLAARRQATAAAPTLSWRGSIHLTSNPQSTYLGGSGR
jgi:hypothetical protein